MSEHINIVAVLTVQPGKLDVVGNISTELC